MAGPDFLLARRHVFKSKTSGSVALTSTTWANLDTALDITIPAAVGDDIAVAPNGYWGNENAKGYLQVATWNGTSLVNWIGSGEPTASTGDGITAWQDNGTGAQQANIAGVAWYTIVAGDIVVDANLGPQVTLRLRYRVTASHTFFSSTTDPFQWSAENAGPGFGSGF